MPDDAEFEDREPDSAEREDDEPEEHAGNPGATAARLLFGWLPQ